jgi:hypothetical protein
MKGRHILLSPVDKTPQTDVCAHAQGVFDDTNALNVYVFERPHILKERKNINDLTCLLK